MSAPKLQASRISKRFGAVRALEDVSVSFLGGEVHAVLGENGAGKSTLMGVLSGQLQPNSGEVLLNGNLTDLSSPAQAKASGIAIVHQHFMLVPEFTVAENLALAGLNRLYTTLSVAGMSAEALRIGSDLGWELEAIRPTQSLSVGAQQRVEIVKSISGRAEVLIFDEPTAVLSPQEVRELFEVFRRWTSEGKAVVLIAHKLSEVMAVADKVTVLRKGRWIAEARIGDVTERQLAEWMVGELPPPRSPLSQTIVGDTLVVNDLVVQGDRGETAVDHASFSLGKGEVLGVGGVDGNGQVELAEAIAGIRSIESGERLWQGDPVERAGIEMGYIPQDRQTDGLALRMSIGDNLLLGGLGDRRLAVGPFLSSPRVRTWVKGLVERFGIQVGSLNNPAHSLSGGNQQKVVVARTLARFPDLLVAVNPTRGLDIQATDYVHVTVTNAARQGAAVLLFSTDLDELAALATRSVFMSRGKLLSGTDASALLGGSS